MNADDHCALQAPIKNRRRRDRAAAYVAGEAETGGLAGRRKRTCCDREALQRSAELLG